MKVQSAKLTLFSFVLALLVLTACGVLEVGIETPASVATLVPPTEASPTSTSPAPTATPLPGLLKPGQVLRIIQIQMFSKTNGWAVSQVETDLNDHLLFTQDGGHSWQDRTPLAALLNPPADGLAATPYFVVDGNAWVVYASHTPQPGQTAQTIWHTADYGKTWELAGTLTLVGFQAEYFLPSGLGFFDEQHGWLLAHTGAGMSHDYIVAFTTADGGKTWQRVIDAERTPDLMSCAKTGLAFSTATYGLLVGNCPGLLEHLFFYTTTDGGQTWQLGTLQSPASQPADLFSNNQAGCGIPSLVYLTARSQLLTLRCDFYATQQPVAWLYAGQTGGDLEARQLPLPFGAVQFLDVNEGWLVGAKQNDPAAAGEIYHTTDGGRTWTRLIATAWQGVPDFIDSNTGWVVARAADKLALVYTSDGGTLWEEITPVITR
jgi:photosystem II stability/assembly factor-like uncharacterized protein